MAGKFVQPTLPVRLPVRELDWEPLVSRIGEANRELARFDLVLYGVPEPDVLLAPLTTQEAVLSSRMEGTRASLEQVLRVEAGQEPADVATRLDTQEIVNYRQALFAAEQELRTRPFSLNLLLRIHGTLLNSVRGRDKARGQFRTTQNWIGPPGSSVENADYVPPAPQWIAEYLDNWEEYYHQDAPDPLVQAAIIHGQFEVIHPFHDGNGRVGRMLVPLFLCEKGLLSRPTLYISEYLEANRDEYVAALRALGTPGTWNRWVTFFLRALTAQAKTNALKARRVIDLYGQMRDRVREITRSQYAAPLVDALFRTPVFYATSLEDLENMPRRQSIATMLTRLKAEGILTVLGEATGRRSQLLAFPELLRICEGKVEEP